MILSSIDLVGYLSLGCLQDESSPPINRSAGMSSRFPVERCLILANL